ncbi:type 1 fimbrial protein [Escherichia coli]|nr:type 1 fimbrial protein [Escherichia coli]
MKLLALGVALMLPMAAYADNTVTFLGEVSDSTCNVTVNGTNGNVTVLLPTALATDLKTVGSKAEPTPFNFVVSGCTAAESGSDSTVAMRLVPLQTSANGNLENIASTGAAENVTIQLVDNYDNANKDINFNSGDYTTAFANLPTTTAGTSVTFPFTAQYYSAGSATAGKVEAQVQYALTYK